MQLPSTSTSSGRTARPSTARRIASSVAPIAKTPHSTLISADAVPVRVVLKSAKNPYNANKGGGGNYSGSKR